MAKQEKKTVSLSGWTFMHGEPGRECIWNTAFRTKREAIKTFDDNRERPGAYANARKRGGIKLVRCTITAEVDL